MPWLLVTVAGSQVGLGHLSRTCGLAQALQATGQTALLHVAPGTIQHLYGAVPHDELVRWMGGMAWSVRGEDAGPPAQLASDPWAFNVVMDLPEGPYWDLPNVAIMADWGPPNTEVAPSAYVCPHETAWTHTWPPEAVVLGGAQYQPLRQYNSRGATKLEGTLWTDPRTAHTGNTDNFYVAESVICMVGVRMYEAIAMGKLVAVVARDEEERNLASAAGVPVMPAVEPTYAQHIESYMPANGAQTLARKLVEVFAA